MKLQRESTPFMGKDKTGGGKRIFHIDFFHKWFTLDIRIRVTPLFLKNLKSEWMVMKNPCTQSGVLWCDGHKIHAFDGEV